MANTNVPNANCIPPASVEVHIGSAMVHIGSVRVFGNQLVGMKKAKVSYQRLAQRNAQHKGISVLVEYRLHPF